jgi:O-antigen/teichoic acid export membrane protein
MSQIQNWKDFLVPKFHRLAEFLFSQGITMAGNLLYGILCIRLLPVPEYAKFVVVFAIQGSLVLLMDIGITGSIVPLVGENIDDRKLIADYVASLRQLAHWLYAIVAPITIVAYPFMVRNRHWSWQVVAGMIAILLVSAWFARVGAAYGSVLIVRRDRRRWYRGQMVSSLGTLALLGIFYAFHWLNGFSAIVINVSGIIFVASFYHWRARQLLGVTGSPSREKRTAIIQLTLPAVPGVVFYALQGQLGVFLITFFGRTGAVASVGALGRLRQVFALFSQMNPILIEPYFAKLSRSRLKVNYLGAMTVTAGLGLTIVALAKLFPELFLWVLGPKYADLRTEVVLVMISGAMGIVGGMMASINNARRFVYYSFVLSDIIATITVETFLIWKMDLSTVKAVLIFNILASLPTFVTTFAATAYGFARGGRRIIGIDYLPEQDPGR